MKKLILLLVLFAFNYTSYSQCDKKIILKSEKGRDLNGDVPGTEISLQATFKILDDMKIELQATAMGETDVLEGEIKEVVICEWKEFLKNGRVRYKIRAKKSSDGNYKEGILDIESKDGFTTLTFGSDDPNDPGKLQFDIKESEVIE